MEALIYVRISKDVAGLGLGVERQEEDARKIAAARGWNVRAVLVDNDISAKGHRYRPAFERSLAMLSDGEAAAVIAWDMTRFLRSAADRLRFLELGKQHGVTLMLVRGNELDMSTPTGRFTADMLGAMALHEIEQKADRQRRAHLQLVESGQPPKRRAFGFPGLDQRPPREIGDKTHVTPETVAVEMDAVNNVFAGILAGDSISTLVRQLNTAGLTTTRGGQWDRSTILALLRNPRYAGMRRKGTELVPGKWEPIIPEETWLAVQAVLSAPERVTNHRRSTARIWLLAGLALCGICDDGTTLRVNYSDGYRVYKCRNRAHLSRRSDHIDQHVTETVIATLSAPDILNRLTAATGDDQGEARRELTALRLRMDRLPAMYASGALTEAQVEEASSHIRQRIAALEQQMLAARGTPVLSGLAGAGNVREAWDALFLDRQRAAIDAVMTVTLLPPQPGGRVSSRFDPNTVRFQLKI